MIRRVLTVVVAVASTVLLAPPSHAIITVTQVLGTLNVTTALTGFETTGNEMVGMSVTAFFAGAPSQTAIWTAGGGLSGSAVGTGWSLSQTGDTFSAPWTLANNTGNSMTRLLIDAGDGSTVFDRTFGNAQGTPGSASGNDFEVPGPLPPFNILATYRDQVALTGNPPVGDLFRNLDVMFTSVGGFPTGSNLTFLADTDSALIRDDVRPAPVPEPGLFALLGSGLAVVGSAAWRHHRRKR